MLSISKNSSLKFWFSWVLTLTAGWSAIQYVGVSVRNSDFRTWDEVFSVAWQFFLNGTLAGVVLGLFCWLAFRLWTKNSAHWGITTFLGYALGSPVGFLLAVVFIWVIARLNGLELLTGSSEFLSMPLIFTMLFSGCLVALSQLPALQSTFETITWKEKTLWVLGSITSWGIGFVLAGLALGKGFPVLLQSASVGLVVSVMTAGILQLLMTMNERVETV